MNRRPLSRRLVAKLGVALPAPLALALTGQAGPRTTARAQTAAPSLPATLACLDGDDAEQTLAQTEGPFFTPSSPERASLLEPGVTGERLVLSGRVLSTGCAPVAGALLEFWQADDAGVYDNVGFRLRGHQFADDEGNWQLETIVPGLYTGRTRHIHVKVQAPNQPELTTQLYFPEESANDQDMIFDPALVVAPVVAPAVEGETQPTPVANGDPADAGVRQATFDFVLELG